MLERLVPLAEEEVQLALVEPAAEEAAASSGQSAQTEEVAHTVVEAEHIAAEEEQTAVEAVEAEHTVAAERTEEVGYNLAEQAAERIEAGSMKGLL